MRYQEDEDAVCTCHECGALVVDDEQGTCPSCGANFNQEDDSEEYLNASYEAESQALLAERRGEFDVAARLYTAASFNAEKAGDIELCETYTDKAWVAYRGMRT